MRNLPIVLTIALCLFSLVSRAAQEYGMASVYSDKFQGSRTASGEVFSHTKLTAAHRTLPFGTIVRITRTDNGKSVVVRINDRGPFVSDRITDLSKSAAQRLGVQKDDDEVRVKLEVFTDKNATSSIRKTPTLEKPVSIPMPEPAEYIAPKGISEPKSVPREYRFIPNKNTNMTPQLRSKSAAPSKSNTPKSSITEAVVDDKKQPIEKKNLYGVSTKSSGDNNFAVQVAALNTHASMTALVSDLQRRSYSNILVHIVEGKGGKPTYKVMLGPFATQAQAESYMKSARKKKLAGFVVNLKK